MFSQKDILNYKIECTIFLKKKMEVLNLHGLVYKVLYKHILCPKTSQFPVLRKTKAK